MDYGYAWVKVPKIGEFAFAPVSGREQKALPWHGIPEVVAGYTVNESELYQPLQELIFDVLNPIHNISDK